jgi:multiple sugar transport system ATP-binding protein
LSIQAPGNIRPHPGDKLNLKLDLDYLFVFDAATGNKLYPIP